MPFYRAAKVEASVNRSKALHAAMTDALGRLLQQPVEPHSQLWADLKVSSDLLPELTDLIEGVSGVDMRNFEWMKYIPASWAVGPGELMWTKLFGAKVLPLSVADLCEYVRLRDPVYRPE